MESLNKRVESCANVYLINDRKVLLIVHHKSKNYVGVGGHKEINESLFECAVRETFEESGIIIDSTDFIDFDIFRNPRPLCSYIFKLEDHLHDVAIFLVRTKQTELTFESPSQEGGWYTFKETQEFPLSEFTSLILRYLKIRDFID